MTRLRLPGTFWRHRAWWAGFLTGAVAVWLVRELPYINARPIVPPVDERPLSVRQDAYGDGRYLAPRSGARWHRGVDLAAPLGSSVRAIRSGTVVQVGAHRGLGRFVELEHAHRLSSLYGHLDAVRVAPGERVKQGEVVGTVGKTGNARHPWIQPHVHLEVMRNGVRFDPTSLGLETVVASTSNGSVNGRGGD